LFFRRKSRAFIFSAPRSNWGFKFITKFFAYRKNIYRHDLLKKKRRLFLPLAKFNKYKVIFRLRGRRRRYYRRKYNNKKFYNKIRFQTSKRNVKNFSRRNKFFRKFKKLKFYFSRTYRFKLYKFFKFNRSKNIFKYKIFSRRQLYSCKKHLNSSFYDLFFDYFVNKSIRNVKSAKTFNFFAKKKIRFYKFKNFYKFFKKKYKLRYRIFKHFAFDKHKNLRFKKFLFKTFFPVLFKKNKVYRSKVLDNSITNYKKINFSKFFLLENFCSIIFGNNKFHPNFFKWRFKIVKFAQFTKFLNYFGYSNKLVNLKKIYCKLMWIISFDFHKKNSVNFFKFFFIPHTFNSYKIGSNSSRFYFFRFKFISVYKKRLFTKFFRFITFSNIFSKLLLFSKNTKLFYKIKKNIIRFLISAISNGKFIYFFPFFYFKRNYYCVSSHLPNNIYNRNRSNFFYTNFRINRRKVIFLYPNF
jgi:hypothetical protein